MSLFDMLKIVILDVFGIRPAPAANATLSADLSGHETDHYEEDDCDCNLPVWKRPTFRKHARPGLFDGVLPAMDSLGNVIGDRDYTGV